MWLWLQKHWHWDKLWCLWLLYHLHLRYNLSWLILLLCLWYHDNRESLNRHWVVNDLLLWLVIDNLWHLDQLRLHWAHMLLW